MYEIMQCPACHGTGETPMHNPCSRCEGFGNIEACLAERPGQREIHDLRLCGHYKSVGVPA